MPESPPTLEQHQRAYWRANLRVMLALLLLWATVSLGCGVLWADWLNQWRLGGVPLGFWFAQQGAIITFVFIILVYALLMNRMDTKYHQRRKALQNTAATAAPPAPQAQGGDA